MIFTTHGHLDDELVELRQTVTEDNDDRTMTRTDKFLKASGEWIGNDLHLVIKKPLPLMGGEQGEV